MSDSTPIRARTGRVIHCTWDLRKTGCGRKCDGYLVEPDTAIDCEKCIRVAQDIEANGN